MAYWLYDIYSETRIIIPYTFAGETAGIAAFADKYNQRFANNGANSGLRVYNNIDVVPMGFSSVNKIKSLYVSEPLQVTCPDEYKIIIDVLKKIIGKFHYTQPGTSLELTGELGTKINRQSI